MPKRASKSSVPNSTPTPPQERVRVLRMEEANVASPPETPEIDDSGLSLEDLGQAYSALLNRGAVPYEDPIDPDEAEENPAEESMLADSDSEPLPPPSDRECELSPRSILEAMLFVGHPQNEPLTARQVASLMRGVVPEEIDELIRELNEQYAEEGCPYWIASQGAGYRLALRDEFANLRDQFYGRVKEAKLSQSAIDTLAIVAYHQPIDVKLVDKFRSKPSGGVLSQLVRRQLLRVEKNAANPKELLYCTTTRFLDLFGLESLEDLPRSQEEVE